MGQPKRGIGRAGSPRGGSGGERAIALDPEKNLAWNNKGDMLKNLGRYDEALAALDRALALDAAVADTWKNRAECLDALGCPAEAAEARAKMAALQE